MKKVNINRAITSINETFSMEEYKILLAVKKNRTWHDFIMLLKDYQDEKEINNEKAN